jgi:hypothetical protein
MDADNFWLARHSGIQMSPNAMRILRAPVSREARGGEPSNRLHGPIVCGIRGVSVQMSFADQEMHYGAPYLLKCRGRSACGRRRDVDPGSVYGYDVWETPSCTTNNCGDTPCTCLPISAFG